MNRHKSKSNISEMTMIALMAALECILGPLALPIPISPVPISLTNLAVYFAVYTLGKNKGTISVFIYLMIGLTGLPVFSGFTGGLTKLVGPTGGYLLGFLFTAYISGIFIDSSNKRCMHFIGMLLGTMVCYMFGTVWLMLQMQMSFYAALSVGVFPFIVADLIKIFVITILGKTIHKRLRMAGLI